MHILMLRIADNTPQKKNGAKGIAPRLFCLASLIPVTCYSSLFLSLIIPIFVVLLSGYVSSRGNEEGFF